VSGLSDWLWGGILSLPFAIIGNLIYDAIIRKLGADNRLSRLSLPLSEEESQVIGTSLILVVILLLAVTAFVFPQPGGTPLAPWPDTIGGRIGWVIGIGLGFIFLVGMLYLAAGFVLGPAFMFAFRRRIDVLLYILLAVGFLPWLVSGAQQPDQYMLALIGALTVAGYALLLLHVPRFLIEWMWSWLTREPQMPARADVGAAAKSPATEDAVRGAVSSQNRSSDRGSLKRPPVKADQGAPSASGRSTKP
jgi:hypothetical protein